MRNLEEEMSKKRKNKTVAGACKTTPRARDACRMSWSWFCCVQGPAWTKIPQHTGTQTPSSSRAAQWQH